MYEANPMAMLIEQAGGAASTGRGRILDVAPDNLHQRVPDRVHLAGIQLGLQHAVRVVQFVL